MERIKVLFILGSLPEDAPYLTYYLKLIPGGIKYDIVGWDRLNRYTNYPHNYHIYYEKISHSYIGKLLGFFKYAKYIKGILERKRYNKIIVFTIAATCFLQPYLIKKFKYQYIFDIRDYSPLIKMPIYKQIFKKMIYNSFKTCISSYGFIKWLPTNSTNKLVASHNIDKNSLQIKYNFNTIKFQYPIKILTIGRLRDANTNIFFIKELANNHAFKIQFAGDGPALPKLQKYVLEHKISNVVFTGKYDKKYEKSIIENTDLINILLPNNILSKSLMSNRFYLSVVHRKPMIVNENCIQASYCKEYSLGLVFNWHQKLDEQIENYCKCFEYEKYSSGCNDFINMVSDDYMKFEQMLYNFLK